MSLVSSGKEATLESIRHAMKNDLSTSQNMGVFKKRVQKLISKMGFKGYSYYNLLCPGDPPIFTTIPPAVWNDYHSQNFHDHDIILSYGKSNNDPTLYSSLLRQLKWLPYKTELTMKNEEIEKFYLASGILDMYLIPFKDEGKSHMLAILDM